MAPRPRGRGFFRHGFKNTGVCAFCGQPITTTRHHTEGRKHSDAVIEACENCHRALHLGDGETPYGETGKTHQEEP